jgi:hypothetical protein
MPRPLEPSWPAILDATTSRALGEVHTALPCIVRSYAVATQTCSCESVVEPEDTPYPVFDDVPVMWPGGAAGFLHVPLAAGDTVLLLFSEEDFSKWWDTGSISAPAVLARHGLHAIAIPGLRRAKAPLSVTGGHVTLGASAELRLGSDAANAPVALEPDVATVLTDFITEVTTVVAALIAPTAIPAAVKVTYAGNVATILARISGGEMAATKVKAV